MKKNLMEDIVKVKKENTLISKKKIVVEEKEEIQDFDIKEEDKGRFKYSLWFVALVAVVFLFFALSFLFSGAKITINPKVKNLDLKENIYAVKDSNGSDLAFDLVVIGGEEKKEIEGGEEKSLLEKAKGTVVFYNSFSTSAQTFAINTRLEGSNGKIYKTSQKISVPGMKKDGTPGSTEVNIYGDEAGEEYNSTPIDFKILGFKGTPKYTKFFARSKGDIKGGVVGKFREITEEQRLATVEELKSQLEKKLLKKVTDQIPKGFILFDGAVFVNTDTGTVGQSIKDNMVPITLKGTLYGVLFKQKDLENKIIENNLTKNIKKENVKISNIKDLVFSIENKENMASVDLKNINFNLSGKTTMVWDVDVESIALELLGKDKKDFNQILSSHGEIDSAELVIKPAWKTSFPENTKDIEVLVKYPN